MAQRGNRAKHVAGVKPPVGEAPAEEIATDDPQIVHTSGGGGMARTSPKDKKASARIARDELREASAEEPGEEALDDDFRTERVPGPGPKDVDAGRATVRQLETHELRGQGR